jgi:DNA mismatch repair protein MutS
MIYDDYIDISEQYRKKYGDRTVLFMQVGDFFEIYAVQNEDEQVGADIYAVADICNLQVSRKNKTILENHRQNPLMAGFPMSIVSKHLQTMVEHGYTVAVMRQVSPPPNPRREITEVIGPSTQLNPQGTDHSYLMVLYWDSIPVVYGSKTHHWAVGMVAIDITTGDVRVGEAWPRSGDRHFAKDEAYRWIQMIQPRELLMVGGKNASESERKVLWDDLHLDAWNLHRKVHTQWVADAANAAEAADDKYKAFSKLAYQEQLFQKLYGGTGCIERMDLERSETIRMAMVYGIQFIYEHNEGMLKRMGMPVRWTEGAHCSVHYNALLQLNVISQTPGERPLERLLNRCSTAFGRRRFKEALLNPLRDKNALVQRYEAVEAWKNHPALETIKKHLGNVLDLERFARRASLRQLAPCEWVSISQSLDSIGKIIKIGGEGVGEVPGWKAVRDFIDHWLVMEEATKYWLNDIRGSVFRTGHFSELDAFQKTMTESHGKLVQFAEVLSALSGESDSGWCKLEHNDRYGYYLSITKKRWDTLTGRSPPPPGYHWKGFKAIPISSSSSVLRITHPDTDQWSHTLLADQQRLAGVATECYKSFMEEYGDWIADHLGLIGNRIGDLDLSITNARNALDFCYTRPRFAVEGCRAAAGGGEEKSFIQAKAMRHPIIERLSTAATTLYVPNDVCLGKDNTDGWLLYGINASGKSSLMKAIGLNVLMAQAGMFVPCESFIYEPYESIFTRISGADNLYRGMSSFTVEMTELRNILLRCHSNTLVLGDELCAGTEALSALSIVAAGVETLAERRASFVFATHLHELIEMNALPPNVSVFHIHIEIDPETQCITYDRHLTPGSGHAYYGLEVCRALGMPDTFLGKANHYRRKIQDQPESFLNTKRSNYNPEVFMDRCALCPEPATETHHIHYQKEAKGNGGSKKHVLHIPVHSAQNLVPLCENCHLKEHRGLLHIEGFRQTSMGRILKVRYSGESSAHIGAKVRS